ncbi:hypothetical protein [Saccharibacter sp. EH60]|uniref:hypothetical protein n=1 Tax=Saccharibacter sp. EH60 TaxID=2689390 RepID=UPI001929703A|nr:hypothetical protein [Saccharibacter sp. EH60]
MLKRTRASVLAINAQARLMLCLLAAGKTTTFGEVTTPEGVQAIKRYADLYSMIRKYVPVLAVTNERCACRAPSIRYDCRGLALFDAGLGWFFTDDPALGRKAVDGV